MQCLYFPYIYVCNYFCSCSFLIFIFDVGFLFSVGIQVFSKFFNN